MNKKSGFRWTYISMILFFALLLVFVFVDFGNGNAEKITTQQAVVMISEGKVSDVYYYDENVRIRVTDSKILPEDFPSSADYIFECSEKDWDVIFAAIDKYNAAAIEQDLPVINWLAPPLQASWFATLMPFLYIGLALALVFIVFKMFSKSNNGAMSFGRSKARMSSNIKVRFSDIAGADEEKEELAEIVEFLKHPQKFTELGARIPKGVLLVGNPGTGKTLLARAVAGESNVPFLSISGSDFVEMFVGVGASRVRDLFEQAKKSLPCIVFIDEIDAVGRQRGAGMGGGNDEREQTLNQLLVEMDGFEANEGIIVLAATNRSDVLDPALLRPGRFDRQIHVHVPDVKGREGIIKIHAKNKPIDIEVNYQTLARITSGFTGADLENMLNEAAILAARSNRPTILMQDITEGINKVIMGPQKRSWIITEKDKLITAYHESGHAILGKLLKNCEEVQEVSIIPRGNAAGYTMSRPINDDNHMGKNKLNDTIAMMMGGRISEELFMEDISTGASNDIKRATEIARNMVTLWGMSEKFGFMNFESSEELFIGRDYQNKMQYSELTASEIDAEIKSILDYNYKRASQILKSNESIIKEMSELLLKKETIYSEEVQMLIDGKSKEEIIEKMDEAEQIRKQREEQGRAEMEKQRKLKEIELRVKTAEMYLKNGIITNADYQVILKERNEAIKKIEQDHILQTDENAVNETDKKINENIVDDKNENTIDETSKIKNNVDVAQNENTTKHEEKKPKRQPKSKAKKED